MGSKEDLANMWENVRPEVSLLMFMYDQGIISQDEYWQMAMKYIVEDSKKNSSHESFKFEY